MRPIDGVANCLDAEAPLVPQPKTKLVGNFWDSLWALSEPPKGRDNKMRRLASKALTNAGPLLSNSAKSSAKMPCNNCGTFSMSTILGCKEATRHKSASTVWPSL